MNEPELTEYLFSAEVARRVERLLSQRAALAGLELGVQQREDLCGLALEIGATTVPLFAAALSPDPVAALEEVRLP